MVGESTEDLIRRMQQRQKRRRIVLNGGQPSIIDFMKNRPAKRDNGENAAGTTKSPHGVEAPPKLSRLGSSPFGLGVTAPRRNLNLSLNLNTAKSPTEGNVDLELTSSNLAKQSTQASMSMKRKNSGSLISDSASSVDVGPTPSRAEPVIIAADIPVPGTPQSRPPTVPPTPTSASSSSSTKKV